MKIREIDMRDFMSHADTRLAFPDRGIVLVRGANGAGKSAIREAVSVALWNKPLRGRGHQRGLSLWASPKGALRVAADGLTVQRSAKGKLSWEVAGAAPQKFENTRKAQEELEKLIGEHAVWSRVSVFSSQDAAHFSTATDSERKRLLEALLGLLVFDEASEACRKDCRAKQRDLEAAQAQVCLLEERARGLEERLKEEAAPEPVMYAGRAVTLDSLRAVREKLDALQAEAHRAANAARVSGARLADVRVAYARAEQDVAGAVAQLAGARQGRCSACGGQLPQERLDSAVGAHRAATQALKQQGALLANAQQAHDRAQEAREAAAGEAADAGGVLAELRAWEAAVAGATARRLAIVERLEDAQDTLDAARAEESSIAETLGELQAADAVLSVSGVRSHILHQALSGIEAVANVWLSRLALTGDYALSLALKPYTESAKGAVKDAISMEIFGAGNGQGYGAASDGEKRRLDVALVLALAEVEAGSSSRAPGTLFFDECFDALDAEGRDSVLEVLEEMAQQCCVVLITHASWPRMEALAAARWTVEGGKVLVA